MSKWGFLFVILFTIDCCYVLSFEINAKTVWKGLEIIKGDPPIYSGGGYSKIIHPELTFLQRQQVP